MAYRPRAGNSDEYEQSSAARLVVREGPEPGQDFRVPHGESFVAGRAPDCDIVLEDPQVSRNHARFYWRGRQFMVEDLGSANGVLVNGVPALEPEILSLQDRVQLGPAVLEVQELPGARVDRQSTLVSPRPIPASHLPSLAPADRGRSLWPTLIGVGVVLGGIILVVILATVWYANRPPVAGPPTVTLITPANGAEVEVGAPMIVQATATDAQGVARLELWVDGALAEQQPNPSPQNQSLFLANFSWSPEAAGSHVLEVRAYNVSDLQSVPVAVTVRASPAVAGAATPEVVTPILAQPTDTPTPEPTASPTFTPEPTLTPTVTPTPSPELQSVAVLNVRNGPGTTYGVIGQLLVGDRTEVIGRSADGLWWQIIYPPNTNTIGWVTAALVQVNQQAAAAPVVEAPPLPPTHTPVPTDTPTAVPEAEISFTADDTSLDQGECTRLRWRVRNVAAYWVDGQAGVGDEGDKQVCDPPGTTTHVLRVQRTDGSTREFTVTINVESGTVSRPSLISPEDDKAFNHFPREVTFVWSSVSAPGNVSYNIQVQYDDGSWKNWKVVTGLSDPTYTMDNFVGANPGRWRVWATSSTLGDGDRTDWREFEFNQ